MADRKISIMLSAAFIVSLLLALNWGASGITMLGAFSKTQLSSGIFWNIRLPRILVALLCGSALAAAGVVSQGFFRNALAGPSILGTSSGANLFVVSYFLFAGIPESWFIIPLLAFAGAILATLGLFIIINRQSGPVSSGQLLLAGLASNAFFGAASTFVVSLSLDNYSLSQSILTWLMGGLSLTGWRHFYLGVPLLLLGLLLAIRVSRKLDVLNLGEDTAASLSINISSLRALAVITIALLVSASVSLSGGIAFVGLIVPHLTRLLKGAAHHRLLFWSCLNGATLVLFADTLARNILTPSEVPVGALIALIGAPFFVYLLTKGQKNYGFH